MEYATINHIKSVSNRDVSNSNTCASYHYLILYLTLAFGIWWGFVIALVFFSDTIMSITGPLTLSHPLTTFLLYLPSLSGLFVYAVLGGWSAVCGIFLKLIPRKQDLIWLPILLGVFVLFILTMHVGSIFLGVKVPAITYSFSDMFSAACRNFIDEKGIVGGLFGWIGFLLPFLQGKMRHPIYSSLLTGFICGLWVLPAYLFFSLGHNASYVLYVLQLMTFILFQSYIFNLTKGSLLFYLFSFWLVATGSHIQLYYFNVPVQILQILFFVLASMIMYVLLRKSKMVFSLQTFPDFITRNGKDCIPLKESSTVLDDNKIKGC